MKHMKRRNIAGFMKCVCACNAENRNLITKCSREIFALGQICALGAGHCVNLSFEGSFYAARQPKK